jgi:mono/diheme cytochrome c family protein
MRTTPLLLLLLTLAGASAARGFDVHVYWENHCAECHGHAGAFARSRLSLEDGVLASGHWGTGVDRFLANHHTSADMLPAVLDILTAQVATEPIFENRCAACHGRAADLVRESLARGADGLVLRRSGQSVEVFLGGHGGLTPAEARALAERLTTIADEVDLP